jgi:hypothetical protein
MWMTPWLAPPPCALERPIGAVSAVERVKLGDVTVGQPEVEELRDRALAGPSVRERTSW